MTRRKTSDYFEEDESIYTSRSKNRKHAHNVKGKGMRVINSYADDDYGDWNNLHDEPDDEDIQRKYNFTLR